MSLITIGELAKTSGVSITAIRYYEKNQLLLPNSRTKAGYRLYTKDTIIKLRFIKNAQQLGFTLDEIGDLIQLQNNSSTTCKQIKAQAYKKLESVEQKIHSLMKIKTALSDLYKNCDSKKAINACPILEALNENDYVEENDDS
ncbi:MAG: heavy metal-responsive transcriptional regulator [Legionellales bacterium]|nr:heavy metal-responsive transcriptional regulator [Legionellales bacterium]